MTTLILLRHAKSEYPLGVPDHDRPLSPRGRRDAPAAGRWLASHAPTPQVVLVSSATRAQQTWELASQEWPAAPDPVTEPRIYEASVPDLRAVVGALSPEADVAVLVGHNPGLEQLAAELGRSGDAAAMTRMRAKYPTSGIAILQVPGGWRELLVGAELSSFAVPRG